MGRRVHFCLTPQSRPDRIAKQKAVAEQHKPWEKSTGPKSEEGKRRASRNSETHGLTSQRHKQLQKALRDTEQSLRELAPDATDEGSAPEDDA